VKPMRVLAVLFVATAAAIIPVSPAAAHVTVSPTTATTGGRGTFSFKVPNERADAATTRVEVLFPEDAVLTSVSLRPVPGWTATVTSRELPASGTATAGQEEAGGRAVTGIVWQGGSIKAGEFQTFDVSMGPLPKTPGDLIFKAIQTYSSGEVVRWIEVPVAGSARPEHPAMVLSVLPPVGAPPPAPAPTDGTARTLATGGLVAGLLALVLAGAALVRRRPDRVPNDEPEAADEPVPTNEPVAATASRNGSGRR